jgi:hypothetical protein
VIDTLVEIGGASCPELVTGTTIGPPPDMYVNPSDTDVRNAFTSLITP